MADRARRKPTSDPAPVVPPPPAQPAFGAFELHQLVEGQCRFPCSSQGADHRFCGRKAERHDPDKPAVWCAEHLPVVFERWAPGGQVLRRAGRT